MIEGLASGARRLDRVRGNMADAEIGQPHRRRHRVDYDRHRRRRRADAKEEDRRKQVDEGRHRLHCVENRLDDRLGAVALGAENPGEDTENHREQHRNAGERERGHGRIPHVHHAPEHHADEGEKGETQPAIAQGRQHDRQHHNRPGFEPKELFDPAQHRRDNIGRRARRPAQMVLEPLFCPVDRTDEIEPFGDRGGKAETAAGQRPDGQREGKAKPNRRRHAVIRTTDRQGSPIPMQGLRLCHVPPVFVCANLSEFGQ